MTDQNDNEPAFTDTPDPYQARNGRREALQAALHLIDKGVDNAETLVGYAAQIDAYLEDGSLPGGVKVNFSTGGVTEADLAKRVSNILDRDLGGAQSIHG